MDMVYEYSDEPHVTAAGVINQILIWLHTLVCQDCVREIKKYEESRRILMKDFFPPSPELEDTIMAVIAAEEKQTEADLTSGVLSIRGWVIAGLIILISLATASFSLDFKKLALETGMSFLLPVGITVGIVLTSYCAIFIGSHLDELSERFGL
jgi:hypothetical protein